MEKEQIKFKVNTRKEIKIRMEINKIKKKSRRSQNQKLFLFENANKMDKSLARLRKKRDDSN